ncbi:GNAT family N-acetyltransferase [Xylanimonas oleitrophica]|uniref:GNAT family N-acetyltransferase n=2 Tax=Xylanimonas oleitrophica TaxID=2607479 RepID=A0A2W5XXL9_9MICO|nr:GNAT family N-acetyltransferase [Xylanimonas oleitrophica]
MTVPAPLDVPLPAGWTARVPHLDDVPVLADLAAAERRAATGSGTPDPGAVAGEVAGPRSWTRRQAVAVDPQGTVRGWASVHDRAAGRVVVEVRVDRSGPDPDAVAAGMYAWVDAQGRELAALRGVGAAQLDAGPYADDADQRRWLAASGYEHVRTWLQMRRPVSPAEAEDGAFPPPRAGVTVRRVAAHENGVPVAVDLQTVHQVLEDSFQDHFNSYREGFAEFLQRLREDPGHRWDHWWLAFVDDPQDPQAPPLPAGALVASVTAPESDDPGTYVEYIGVHRRARGRGVAKGLLYAVVADAARRGRSRVSLEVDADSPTGADGLYTSLGWETAYATESWHKDVEVR